MYSLESSKLITRCGCRKHRECWRQSHCMDIVWFTGLDGCKQLRGAGIRDATKWGSSSIPVLLVRSACLLPVRLDGDICFETWYASLSPSSTPGLNPSCPKGATPSSASYLQNTSIDCFGMPLAATFHRTRFHSGPFRSQRLQLFH